MLREDGVWWDEGRGEAAVGAKSWGWGAGAQPLLMLKLGSQRGDAKESADG